MLLIQSTNADSEQTGKDRQMGRWPGAPARRHTLAHRQGNSGKTECEPEPLKSAHHFAEQRAPEKRSDYRHGADHQRDEPDVHPLGGGPVESSELKPQLQGANESAV